MANLIDDSLFGQSDPYINFNQSQKIPRPKQKTDSVVFTQKSLLQTLKQNFVKLVPGCKFVQQYYIHQIGQFHLVIAPSVKINGQQAQLFIEADLLKNQIKHVLTSYLTRILFGKQIIKPNLSRNSSIVINFDTGQIKIKSVTSCTFRLWQLHTNAPYIKNFCRCMLNVYNSLIKCYQQQILFIFNKIIQMSYELPFEESCQKNQKFDVNQQLNYLVKLLKISTFESCSFQNEKQSFTRIADFQKKQKQQIIKLQTKIDITFSGLGKEIQLFSILSPKQQIKPLVSIGTLKDFQKQKFARLLNDQKLKRNCASQYQYVLNCIGLLKIQNKKHFISGGATSMVYMTKILFQYVFSDDPKYWLQLNKTNKDNIFQKLISIKQAKDKVGGQKIKHQNQIIHRMKGGNSVFLLKYYKIESLEPGQSMNQNILIMDYINGQTLNQYIQKRIPSLSLWSKLYVILNIVHGLRFISEYNITHNDLKPNNILIGRQIITKIIDFGEAYHQKVCKQNYRPGFTLPYSAPQLFSSNTLFNEKTDIFSLGVIMYEVIFNRRLFQINYESLQSTYNTRKYQQKILIAPENLQDYGKKQVLQILLLLIFKCLSKNQQQRPCLNWIAIIIKSLLQIYILG